MREMELSEWADRHRWCIISPSLSRRNYWKPKGGFAQVVISAVEKLRKRRSLRSLPVFLFGYSAGGQLVSSLLGEGCLPVEAWGVYGCGVYPDSFRAKAPGVIACGRDDFDRYRISREYVYRYRESGGLMLWMPVSSGHELNVEVIGLIQRFFEAVATGRPCTLWGEDDTMQIRSREEIDPEFCNPLYNSRVASIWRRCFK